MQVRTIAARFRDARPLIAATLAASFAVTLGGCSLPIADLPLIGIPANTPARAESTGVYPAVHDVPPQREQAVLEPEERARIEKELVAARDRQAKAGGAADSTDARTGAKKKSSQAN